jgi:hypothetical protein
MHVPADPPLLRVPFSGARGSRTATSAGQHRLVPRRFATLHSAISEGATGGIAGFGAHAAPALSPQPKPQSPTFAYAQRWSV